MKPSPRPASRDLPGYEDILAAACKRLVARDCGELAAALAEGKIMAIERLRPASVGVQISIETNATSFEVLTDEEGISSENIAPFPSRLAQAFDVVLGARVRCVGVRVTVRPEPAPAGWRGELMASLNPRPARQGRRVGGQHISFGGLRYGSHSEVAIARELTRLGIPFAPGCVTVVGGVTIEPDFVIFHRGRVLVIEIHGRPFHPARRMTDEWNRTRPLLAAGAVVDFIEAADAISDPVAAVSRALALLEVHAA